MGLYNKVKRLFYLLVRWLHPSRTRISNVRVFINGKEIDYFHGENTENGSVVTIPGADKLPKGTPLTALYSYEPEGD